MQFRFVYLALGASVCTLLMMCQPDPNLNQFVSVPFPLDNPSDSAKIALGKKLFFDTRLSLDNTVSCATCHKPGKAFTDGLKTSVGINGLKTDRNSPSLLNAGFLPTVMFDAHLKTLELQVLVPLQEPNEMGHNMKVLIPELRAIPEYQQGARRVFNRDFDAWVLTRSLGAFERSLVSMSAPFDEFQNGDESALNASEKAGWNIFSEKLYCTQCHAPPNFTNHEARNNGLYSDYGEDKGRFRIHLDSADIGSFKVPSLRNIELTAPYMHDGTFESLEEVLTHYAQGGAGHYLQDQAIVPFELSPKENKQLLDFLRSLTDLSFLERL
jgi:cytochrome c peroxidase